jgi:hypothetical protein
MKPLTLVFTVLVVDIALAAPLTVGMLPSVHSIMSVLLIAK